MSKIKEVSETEKEQLRILANDEDEDLKEFEQAVMKLTKKYNDVIVGFRIYNFENSGYQITPILHGKLHHY